MAMHIVSITLPFSIESPFTDIRTHVSETISMGQIARDHYPVVCDLVVSSQDLSGVPVRRRPIVHRKLVNDAERNLAFSQCFDNLPNVP